MVILGARGFHMIAVGIALADFRQSSGNFEKSKHKAEKNRLLYINYSDYAYNLARKCFKDELGGPEFEIIRNSCDF